MEWFQFARAEILAWNFQYHCRSPILQKHSNVSLSHYVQHYLLFRELFLFENGDESGVEFEFLFLIQIPLGFFQSLKVELSQRFVFALETKAQAELFNNGHMTKEKKKRKSNIKLY